MTVAMGPPYRALLGPTVQRVPTINSKHTYIRRSADKHGEFLFFCCVRLSQTSGGKQK